MVLLLVLVLQVDVDGLIEQLGGRPTPGVGFATGIERIILNLQRQNAQVPPDGPAPAVVAYRGSQAKLRSVRLASELREQGIATVLAPDKSLRGQLRYASNMAAPHVLILGDAELAKNTVTLRDMVSGEQEEVPAEEVARRLRPA